MVSHHGDDGDGNGDLPTDAATDGGRRVGRRGYLKLAGAAVAATGAGAAAGGAAAQEYRTVTVPEGGSETFEVGSGETLENLLVDVSAQGADAHITATGDDWTVRNVGVKGAFDLGSESGGSQNVMDVGGTGVVENVYFGDGHTEGVRRGAIGCGPSHAGHVEFRNVHIAGWSGNAVYAAGPGRVNPPGKTDGQGGTLAFKNCYFANNNIAHLRIASDGSVVEGCVFTNTGEVPPHPNTSGGASGVVNSRGIYTGYGDPSQTVEVRDCDFELTSENTNGSASAVVSDSHSTYGDLTTVRVVDCEVRGGLVGDQVVTENVGDSPETSIPDGTPATAEEAVGGAGGDGGATGNETGANGTSTTGATGGNATGAGEGPDVTPGPGDA